jgi:anti-anti-sigma factor
MDKKFEVEVDKKSDVSIMYLSGDITAFSDEEINKAYKGIEFADVPRLIVSFEKVGYMNSGGVATLVGIVADMVKKTGTLKFSGLSPHYQKVVEIVGITEYVELHNTVEEALAEMQK